MLPSRRVRWFYWGGLIILVTVLVTVRRQIYLTGTPASSDLVVLIVWLALLLSPLFQAVELFGLKFQHKIDELKQDVALQLSVFRTEIAATMTANSTASSAVNIYSERSSAELETLKKVASESAIQREKKDISGTIEVEKGRPSVPCKVNELFAIRFNLEQKLGRIMLLMRPASIAQQPRRPALTVVIRALETQELLPGVEAEALRAMWGITSQAVHGVPVSQDEFEFVRDMYLPISESLDQVAAELERRDWE